MIAELGVGALIGATLLCLLLAYGIRQPVVRIAPLLHGIFICVSFAMLALILSFAASDFSVSTVFANSHTQKPLLYKITGTWGNHEGSMLLWVWSLTALTFAYGVHQRWSLEQKFQRATLGLLGGIIAGFLGFILFTSNPFARLYPPPWEGQGLNPLLQDIGLAIHPPLLYLGYVGFALVSAQAVAILLARGDVDQKWARALQPWALLSWGFLTLGIGMGSWWAYRELGWGGWWFWDPVENISLLPWLSGTALIHCLVVLSRRPVLQNWTLLLAIFTFTFSLLGTFLVRSGVLTSVHSFASDPARGLYILGFVSLITLGSLWLYALRYPAASRPDFQPISREGGILVNNLLLTALCATVLLAITYPLILQALNLPSVSVGAPYYEQVFLPVALLLVTIASVGPLLPWKMSSWAAVRRPVLHGAIVAAALIVACGILLPWKASDWFAGIALIAGAALFGGSLSHGARLWRNRNASPIRLPQAGMWMAHLGLALVVVAATLSSAFRETKELVLVPDVPVAFAGYQLTPGEMQISMEKNYAAHRVTLATDAGFELVPESRFYPERGMETAEAAIHSTLLADDYAAISPLPDPSRSREMDRQFALRLYHLPGMFWLWLGFLLAGLGGLVAAGGHFRENA